MLYIKVHGIDELQADLDDLIKDHFPKMKAIALTATAIALCDETKEEMKRVFDKPTRWTLGGVFYKSASVNDFNAAVWFKDERAGSGKGTPAVKYLWPEVEGGPRNLKRYERALNRFGVLPTGYYTVPSKHEKLDDYGNISQGRITQILTGVGALAGMSDAYFNDVLGGYKRRKTTTTNFFIIKQKHRGLVPGIWERIPEKNARIKERILTGNAREGKVYKVSLGRYARPVMLFVKGAPKYQKRFPFYRWAQAFVEREGLKIFKRTVDETLVYWKRKRGA